jgi:hypothetical protein
MWALSIITDANGEIAMAEGHGNILVEFPNAIPTPEPFRLRDVWCVLELFCDLLSVSQLPGRNKRMGELRLSLFVVYHVRILFADIGVEADKPTGQPK